MTDKKSAEKRSVLGFGRVVCAPGDWGEGGSLDSTVDVSRGALRLGN